MSDNPSSPEGEDQQMEHVSPQISDTDIPLSETNDLSIKISSDDTHEPTSPPPVASVPSTKAVEVLKSNNFPANFFYSEDAPELARPSRFLELSPDFIQLHRSFGLDCARRNNLHLLDAHTLLFILGNTVQSLDLTTGKQEVIYGHNQALSAGVSALAVHPSQRYLAIAEAGTAPNIYVYSWPSLRVVRVLRGGAESVYGALAFSPCGTRLGSVSGDPDFLLTVWHWADERVLLRNKAFSQAVWAVLFSPDSSGALYTAGQAHIKFWTLAQTFTGLKLQGALGKFGQLEMCDVLSLCECGGAVASGTEHGGLLLWEDAGHGVQAVLRRRWGAGRLADGFVVDEQGAVYVEPEAEAPAGFARVVRAKHVQLEGGVITSECHAAGIEQLSVRAGVLTTVGGDGFLRQWSWPAVAEAQGHALIDCLHETDTGVPIRSAVRVPATEDASVDVWVVLDAAGSLSLVEQAAPRRVMLSAHSGATVGCRSAFAPVLVTGGACGSLRAWDVSSGRQLFARQLGAHAITGVQRISVEGRERFLVCSGEGAVRVVALSANGIVVLGVARPHNTRITSALCSADGTTVVTAAADGTVFLLRVSGAGAEVSPEVLVQLPPLQTLAALPGDSTDSLPQWVDSCGEGSGAPRGDGIASGVCGPVSLCWGAADGTVAFGYGRFVVELSLPLAALAPRQQDVDTYVQVRSLRLLDPHPQVTVRCDEDEEDAGPLAPAPEEDAAGPQEEVRADPRLDAVGVLLVNPFAGLPHHPLSSAGKPSYLVGYSGASSGDAAAGMAILDADLKYRSLLVCPTAPQHTPVLAAAPAPGTATPAAPMAGAGAHGSLELGSWVQGVTAAAVTDDGLLLVGGANGTVELRDQHDIFFHLTAHLDASPVLSLCGAGPWVGYTTAGGGVWVLKQDLAGALGETERDFTMDRFLRLQLPQLVERERAKHIRAADARAARDGAAVWIPFGAQPGDEADYTQVWGDSNLEDAGALCPVYAIEESRRRHEKDEGMAASAKKVSLLRHEMGTLRAEFELLQQRAAAAGLRIDGRALDAEAHAALRAQAERVSAELSAAMRDEVEAAVAGCEALVRELLRDVELEELQVTQICGAAAVRASRTTALKTQPCPATLHERFALSHAPEYPPALPDLRSNAPSAAAQAANDAPTREADAERRRVLRVERREEMKSLYTAMQEPAPVAPAPGAASSDAGGVYHLKLDGGLGVDAYGQPAGEGEPSALVGDAVEADLEHAIGKVCLCTANGLRQSVWSLQRAMWDRVAALRQVKYALLREVYAAALRVAEINALVGTEAALLHPDGDAPAPVVAWVRGDEETSASRDTGLRGLLACLSECCTEGEVLSALSACVSEGEWPEAKYVVADDELHAWAVWREEEARLKRAPPVGTFEGSEEPTSDLFEADPTLPPPGPAAAVAPAAGARDQSEPGAEEAAEEALLRVWERRDLHAERLELLEPDLLDDHARVTERAWLREERAVLLGNVAQQVQCFDASVAALRVERLKVARDVAALRTHLLSAAEEHAVAGAYADVESVLRERASKSRAALAAVEAEAASLEASLRACAEQRELMEARRAALLGECNSVVQAYLAAAANAPVEDGEETVRPTAEWAPLLMRLFMQNQGAGASPGDGEDEDDEEESSGPSVRMVESVCDAGVLQTLHELRAARMQAEAAVSAAERRGEEIQTAQGRVQQRGQALLRELRGVVAEARQVGLDRRRAVQHVRAGVAMRASQILVGGEGPDGSLTVCSTLSDHVLIGTDTLDTLRTRVEALGSQCTLLQQRVRALKREAHVRAREVEQKQRVLAAEEAHCREVQLLKFGQTVQLEALGQRPEEQADEQLKRKVRWIEELGERKTRQWEKRVRDANDELLRATEENTALLEKAGRLRELQHQVERSLDTQTQQLHNTHRHGQAALGGPGRGGQQQISALTATLQHNESQIDSLKAELHALKSKQGRVYAPGQG